MAKFLKFISVLLFAFLLMNMLYLLLLSKVDWDFSKTKEAHGFKNQQLKTLVFGNSTSLDGVNAEMLSEQLGSTYNFSVGGASLESNYLQLKDYLKNNAKPARVLLFISSAHVNYKNQFEVNPIIEHYYSNTFMGTSLKDIPLYKFRWLFVENIKKLLSANHRKAEIKKGQLQIKVVVPDNTVAKIKMDDCLNNEDYNNPGFKYLWQIIALCKQEGISISIFEMPCWKNAQNDCGDLLVNNKAEKNTDSVLIYNLNNVTRCNTLLDAKKDWLSKNHLNYFGSVKITNEIIRILSNPSHQAGLSK